LSICLARRVLWRHDDEVADLESQLARISALIDSQLSHLVDRALEAVADVHDSLLEYL
jgi:hypothetical protein